MTNPKCRLVGCSNRALKVTVTLINQEGERFDDILICRTHMEEFIKSETTVRITVEERRYPWAKEQPTSATTRSQTRTTERSKS
jgi:hypothetical protein